MSRGKKTEPIESEEQNEQIESEEQNESEEQPKKQRKTKDMKAGKAKKSNSKKVGSKTNGKNKSTTTGKNNTKSKSKKTSNNEEEEEENKRTFKLINAEDGSTHGRYTGDTPKQAASKAYTKMVQKLNKEKQKIPKLCVIYLRESTRKSPKKIYGYESSRLKLDKPQKLEIVDNKTGKTKEIIYRFRNKIRKVVVDMEQFGGNNKQTKKTKKRSGSKTSAKKNTTSKTTAKKTTTTKTVKKNGSSKQNVKKSTSSN